MVFFAKDEGYSFPQGRACSSFIVTMPHTTKQVYSFIAVGGEFITTLFFFYGVFIPQ